MGFHIFASRLSYVEARFDSLQGTKAASIIFQISNIDHRIYRKRQTSLNLDFGGIS